MVILSKNSMKGYITNEDIIGRIKRKQIDMSVSNKLKQTPSMPYIKGRVSRNTTRTINNSSSVDYNPSLSYHKRDNSSHKELKPIPISLNNPLKTIQSRFLPQSKADSSISLDGKFIKTFQQILLSNCKPNDYTFTNDNDDNEEYEYSTSISKNDYYYPRPKTNR